VGTPAALRATPPDHDDPDPETHPELEGRLARGPGVPGTVPGDVPVVASATRGRRFHLSDRPDP
jgi:hypothetical protein